jgi:vacuolar-type H+-ATPase subunit I/STV1
MDPLTALSVAGTVVQFVDFSIKILSTTRKLYHSVSGNLPAYEELEYITTDISRLAARLQKPLDQDGGAQACSPELQELCSKCSDAALELLHHLDQLKVDKKKMAWQSFRVALQASWTKEDLNELVTRLNACKQSIQMRILAELRYRSISGRLKSLTNTMSFRDQVHSISLAQYSRFDSLDSRLQQTIASLLDQRNSNAEDLRDQTLAVAQMLNRTEYMISNQHEISRATIINAIIKYGGKWRILSAILRKY